MFKPMLAAKIGTEGGLRWPLVVSTQIGGTRAIASQAGLLGSDLKMIPNRQLQTVFRFALEQDPRLRYMDFAITSSNDPQREDGVPSVTDVGHEQREWHLWALDHLEHLEAPYWGIPGSRHSLITDTMGHGPLKVFSAHGVETSLVVHAVPQTLVASIDELVVLEDTLLRQGWWGLMVRDPESSYKCGRSTIRELNLGKLRRFEESTATVAGFREQFTFGATKDHRGFTRRAAQDGRVAMGCLGTLVAEDPQFGRIEVSAGFTGGERQHIWNNPERYVGRRLGYKHYPVGSQDKPRFPVFDGWPSPLVIKPPTCWWVKEAKP